MKYLWQIWQLPITLIMWLFYALPFWAFRQIRFDGWADFAVARFMLRVDKDNWYIRAWGNWGGFSGPGFIILKYKSHDLELHELRHAKQWQALGIFFPVVYGLFRLMFGYYNHPLEVDARRAEKRRRDNG